MSSTIWSVDEHLEDILATVKPLEPIELQLPDAQGCVLVEDVTVQIALPPFDNSSMDGYAVRTSDVAGASEEFPAVLTVIGDVAAGSGRTLMVGPGEAARIMTGAPLPPGARPSSRSSGPTAARAAARPTPRAPRSVPPRARPARSASTAPSRRGRTSARAAATSRPATSPWRPVRSWARPRSACSPPSAAPPSRSGPAPASSSCRPAANWSSPACSWPRGRSTTPTASR